MKSLQAFTREIDDIEKAVTELDEQIDRSSLLKNTFAIIFCGYEVNIPELAKALAKTFFFPFIGCSSLGMLSTKGYSQMSISMIVLTADDCDFSLGLTEEISGPGDMEKVEKAYENAADKLPEKEKLILAYSPWQENGTADEIITTFDKCSGGVPIFGGIASDAWSFKEDYVFFGGEVSKNKTAYALISGNIKPVFTIAHSVTRAKSLNETVTESRGTEVYTVNGVPIADYLAKKGFITNKTDVMFDYLATPFISTRKTEDDDEVDILRCLVSVDQKKKSCRFIGNIEEGSKLNMVLIGKNDIEGSAKKAFGYIIEQINEAEDYEYSTILCSSCIGRYCLIVSDKNAEGRAYMYNLPDNVNVNGFYGCSEYCPVEGKKNGRLYNASNNESLAVVAF